MQRFGVLRAALVQAGWLRLLATVGVLALAVVVARFGWHLPVLVTAERGLYDVRAAITAPRVDQDSRVVLVTFTEETLAATGKRSPLDRVLLGKALANLDTLKPRAIGVDILIDQPQPDDAVLETALKALRTPTYFAFSTAAENGEYIMPWQEQHLRALFARVAAGSVRPASIRLDVDADNGWRTWPSPAKGPPALLVNAITGAPGFGGFTGAAVMRKPKFVDRPVFASFPIDLFADAEAAAALAPAIAGRIVLIGADLPEADRFITPLTRLSGATTAGVELHATLIAQALDGRRPVPVPGALLWLLAFAAVLLAAVTGGFDLPARLVVPLGLAQVAGILVLPFVLQGGHRVDTYGLPAAGLAAGWLLSVIAASTTARIVGSEQRRFAQGALGRYLPRDVAQQILREPGQLALHGERREIYALFTDIEDFTRLCQTLDPESVATMLNEYLETMSKAVLGHGGTIDKFVGDAVVAFWGAPLARADDAQNALAAAIAMSRAGAALMRPVAGRASLGRTRVGLHRGMAIVGNFGGEGRIQYTALGDSMNVAARLEGANKTLKTAVLVSREAAERAGMAQFRPMGRVRVRGRDAPIEVFEPLGVGHAVADPAFAALYAQFDAGDTSVLPALAAKAAAAPDDVALAYLLRRMEAVGPGGYHDLD
ncbi:MAG: adenylate/guanylate cyclase domain-containing protein [Alphaproteobacteria bacterium]|nr:MAG: adenylate/guanylate cyclase domain-containing protein [Alphaproteobacteria bacterium]